MSVFHTVDISKICNHKIIYSDSDAIDETCGLDGEFIAERDLKITQKDNLDGVDFQFCFGEADNILCEGQTININQQADKMHIIGFAYWGDTIDVLTVCYDGNEKEHIKIPFTDWAHKVSEDYRDRAFLGKNIHTSRFMITSGRGDHLACLHHAILELTGSSKIQSIILPNNLFLHVLAITLEKNN